MAIRQWASRAADRLLPSTGSAESEPVGQRAEESALTTVTSAPGSRRLGMFFDSYPRFYDTSETASSRTRLNMRYEGIFAENADLFEGARVLDIASHDGRWSLAALASGAASVTGIEARPELVDHARSNLAGYGFGEDRADFVVGDVHEVLNSASFDVDVVLCLGFLYHTLRYPELFHGIRRTGARHVIIDTQASRMMAPRALIQVYTEPSDKQSAAAADAFTHGNTVLTGRPNLEAIRDFLDCYGYEVERGSDYAGIIRDNAELTDEAGCGDYRKNTRVTLRCRATEHPSSR